MSIGALLLIVLGVLIYFGAAQRVLDKLYLTDIMALVVIAGIIIGSFVDFTVLRNPVVTINLGGAIIPVILAIYVLSRAGTYRELVRTIIAVVLTGGAIYGLSQFFKNFGHGRDIIDPMYVFAISGGVIAYLLGRSRRASFIAGTLGYLTYNLIILGQVLTGRVVSQVMIGGAGAFDSIIISGLLAVLLAELVGETRERIQGGPVRGNNLPGKERRSDDDEK
ncbi:DUF1614 domain-containing protein [Halothermothrix orenii]|uniref:DUF1614 domain-containing protein n=1 Tax=Halothermothrix orenii (strain H 168 / OCM 544 / DSM 9562) TaxID=373903 RepID=B8CWY3_HALOH|nr:DUF1614 domain-containing protein [Halothermothrix orenii]ACL69802.1 Protein of unknown function (DUF1614) [Halothermothrix orenii H 168]